MKAIIYGFETAKCNIIMNQIGFEGWEILDTDDYRDIIAIEVDIIILNLESISVDQVEDIWEVLRYDKDAKRKVYFVSEQESKAYPFTKQIYRWSDMLHKLPHDLCEINSLKNETVRIEAALIEQQFISMDIEFCNGEIVGVQALKYCLGTEVDRFHSWIRPQKAIRLAYENVLDKTNAELAEEPRFEEIAEQLYDFIGDSLVVMYRDQGELSAIRHLFAENKLTMKNHIIDILDVDKFLGQNSKQKSLRHLSGKWLDTKANDYVEKIARIFKAQQELFQRCIRNKTDINDCFLDTVAKDLLGSFVIKDNELVIMNSDSTDQLTVKEVIKQLEIAGYIITEIEPCDMNSSNLMGEIIYESRGACHTVRRGAPVYEKVVQDTLDRRIILCDARRKVLSDDSIRAVTQSIYNWFQYDDRPYELVSLKGLYTKYFILTDNVDLWKRFIELSVFDEEEVDYDYIDTRNFKTKVIEHIEDSYEVINCTGTKSYILPEDRKDLNILEPFRDDFMSYASEKKIKWHRYANRMNSSQAMCFNLFYPLIINQQLEAIASLMGCYEDINYESVAFEKLSELESNKRRRTNFDFYFETVDGKKFFFEIKYTEDGFAETKDDVEHMEKFEVVYKPILMVHPGINDTYKVQEKFFNHYQIMRNLIHMDDNSYVIFIYPKENKKVRQQARKALFEIVEVNWAEHFVTMTLESFVEEIPQYIDNQLAEYYRDDFSRKYII